MNGKWVAYFVADIGALAWLYYGVTDKLPLETLLGFSSEVSTLAYAVIGAVGVISLVLTVMSLAEGRVGVELVAYLVADVGAVAWALYGVGDMLIAEDVLGLSASTASGFYVVVGVMGVVSFLVTVATLDDDSSLDMPS